MRPLSPAPLPYRREEMSTTTSANKDSTARDESLRLAIAMSLLRSRIHNLQSSSSFADALRWKQKAKERKQEIIRLREDLKEAENASHCGLFLQGPSCQCHFFDNLGNFSPTRIGDASDMRFNDVLRRRFLRLELKCEDEAEQLKITVDFLVELCETDLHRTSNFSNWSHQAVDFILVSLKNLLPTGKNLESIEGCVSYLLAQLISGMLSPLKGNVSIVEATQPDTGFRFYIQHLIRKLGRESYIGQRAIFSVSQRICLLAESLLFMDPFDESFPEVHECVFILMQLTEFLVSDYLLSWSEDEAFETAVFEEWITSVVQARKAVEALEDRNGLYVLYMDRVMGELAKQIAQISSFQELKTVALAKFFA